MQRAVSSRRRPLYALLQSMEGAIVPITRTLAEAFSFYRAKAANPRWAWAAQSDDGKTVVITMWEDEMGKDGDTIVYASPPGSKDRRQGCLDRIKKLQHAQNKCGGLLRTVIIEAVDTKAGTRSTRRKYIVNPSLVMKLVNFNAQTGEFLARSTGKRD